MHAHTMQKVPLIKYRPGVGILMHVSHNASEIANFPINQKVYRVHSIISNKVVRWRITTASKSPPPSLIFECWISHHAAAIISAAETHSFVLLRLTIDANLPYKARYLMYSKVL